ncbi:MAG: hypothetical protein QW210_04395 [Candidatus Woesearchaeota archaeon]
MNKNIKNQIKYVGVGLGALAALVSLYNTNPKKVEQKYDSSAYVQEWHDTKESVYDLPMIYGNNFRTMDEMINYVSSDKYNRRVAKDYFFNAMTEYENAVERVKKSVNNYLRKNAEKDKNVKFDGIENVLERAKNYDSAIVAGLENFYVTVYGIENQGYGYLQKIREAKEQVKDKDRFMYERLTDLEKRMEQDKKVIENVLAAYRS